MSDSAGSGQVFRKIDRGRMADQILDELRDKILRGDLPHGARFPADRELAEQYGVSTATVREAVRALDAMGLVSVRHGSGSFVTVRTETLIAVSMASAIQLEGSPATDVMEILGVLNSHAAGIAVLSATDEEIAALREAAESLAAMDSLDQAMENLRRFLRQLSAISHNPLLAALCSFLGDIQVELAIELSERQLLPLRQVAGDLYGDRIAVVEALEARDRAQAVRAVRAYHEHALELITSSPRAQEIRDSDPGYAGLISSLMSTKLASLAR
jgi:GntR family transcriptional repressor for pyruvate dehydrogenase complex